MTLPFAATETFQVVNSTPYFPNELANEEGVVLTREDVTTENALSYEFFGSARRMQHLSFEDDPNFIGEDGLINSGDEGRSLMLAYEEIPFRVEQGSKPFIIGDSFSFDAVLANPWNLAASLKVENDLSPELLKSSEETPITTTPLSLYSSQVFCRPSYWFVKPHLLATLVIINVFPMYCDKSIFPPSILLNLKS